MESNINHIISRVLSGEATSEDILSLSNWLNEDEKNQEEFRHLKSYWDAEVTYNKEFLPMFSIANLTKIYKAISIPWKTSFHTFFLLLQLCSFNVYPFSFIFIILKIKLAKLYTIWQVIPKFCIDDGTVLH